MTALLDVTGMTKRFGHLTAVDACSFSVAEGSITALIGPNGSGKTTVFNLITGYLPTDSGSVAFDGRSIAGADPGGLYRQGLSRTFQQARVFGDLTVQENLVVAAGGSWRSVFGRRMSRSDRIRAAELLEEFKLSHVADLFASELSWGQRKLLEFAAVLMSRPRLVLLDEPTAGVNPLLIQTMASHIRSYNATGVTFLIVEHDMSFVMTVCDQVIVLDRGKTICVGTPEAVQSDPRVLDAYLGD
ncbi:MAG: amino acid/amide transporter ATP-binding protein 1, family [Frankiales bacterium]|nr:amino acid/amide transporter ATP-binding protein 1, family [Frankiales bacterium]